MAAAKKTPKRAKVASAVVAPVDVSVLNGHLAEVYRAEVAPPPAELVPCLVCGTMGMRGQRCAVDGHEVM